MKEKSLRGILVGTIVLVLLITLIGTKSINNTYAIDSNEKNIDGLEISVISQNGKKTGDLVFLNLKYDNSKYSDNLEVIFEEKNNGKTYSAPINEVNTKRGEPYFIIPIETKVGTYEITKVLAHDINNQNNVVEIPLPEHLAIGGTATFYVESQNTTKTVDEIMDSINLNKFYLKDSAIYSDLNENPGVRVDYVGDNVDVYLSLKNKENSYSYYIPVTMENKNSGYFSVKDVVPGKYEITEVNLCIYKLSCKTYTKNPDETSLGEIEVLNKNNNTNFKLVAINLNTLNAEPGDKVYVDVNANKDISSALLVFYDSYNKKTFSAYVKNIKGHGYFMLPSTVESGGYRVQSVIIKDNDGNTQVTNVPDFAAPSYTDDNGVFYETIEMFVQEKTEENKDSLVFNNEEYDDLINKKIESLSDTGVITVICDNAPLVRSTLFKKIANTRKTLILQYGDSEWVFNGTDIVDPKYIDVSMLISSIKNSSEFGNSNISNLISEEDTSILSFANNGTLPGKALIRLNSVELDSKFGNRDIFVYYYNTEEDKLFKIALEVQKIEGYYEFYINHNSDYVLSTKALEGDYVVENRELLELNSSLDIKGNNKIDNTKLTNIALACTAVIVLFGILILLRLSKYSKIAKTVQKEETKKEVKKEETKKDSNKKSKK